MDTATDSPATAENPADESATPPTAETTTTTTEPSPEQVLAGNNIDDIRALMRKNDDALVQTKRDSWTGLNEDEEQPAGDEAPGGDDPDPNAEAKPGTGDDDTSAQLTAEEQEKADKDAAAAEAAKANQPKKDLKRVRISRFAEEDQAVIARMAEKDGLTIDQARAELVAEGKLQPKAAAAAATTTTAETKAVTPSADIAAKTTEIADLEKQMEEAGAAFDTAKMAKLNIAHNKALAELGKLESKAEAQQSQAQQQEQSRAATVADKSEAAAIEAFPDAATEGTPLYEAIEDWLDDPANADLVKTGRWHLIAAQEAAQAIGYQPPAKKAATVIVPKKPARPAPVQVGSGALNGAASRRQPSPAESAAAALAGNDVEAIRQQLRVNGTRSLDDE